LYLKNKKGLKMRILPINQQMNTSRMNQNAPVNKSSHVNFGTIFQDPNKAFEIAKNPAKFLIIPVLNLI
jgi:hypothetical protein